MPISVGRSASVVSGGASVSLSTLFNLAPPASGASANPAYIVVCGLDRNEYTVGSSGATGSFAGNGATARFSSIGGDGRGAGVVFAWQASTGQYVSQTYGALAKLAYVASTSANDVTNISLFGTNSAQAAQAYANNAYALMQTASSGYLGSATVVTSASFAGTVPLQATPDSIASVASGFVGRAWNDEGCWVLASSIAAEAGASLPVQSTAIGMQGAANGEWFVAYNGPASGGAGTNWQSLVSTGDIVAFEPASGGGHITTCVSGSGSTAQLVDNIVYANGSGGIANSAKDGSAADIIIAPPHPASQEFAGAPGQEVVIYALDTPVVTPLVASAAIPAGGALSVAGLVRASDPEAGHSVTAYQLYDSSAGGSFTTQAGAGLAAHSAAAALTVPSLSGVTLSESGTGGDVLEIRASNGTYWGDWQAIAITKASAAAPPRLTAQTAAQSWKAGGAVSLQLASNTFTDPQGQALTYRATGPGGAALPGWLAFSAATRVFSGTVPAGLATIPIVVTATDTSGLSNSETFVATVPASAPFLASQTPNQSWPASSHISWSLPQGTFADPQHEALTCTASLASGAALPSWLSFNGSTGAFIGTAPASPSLLRLKVTATDTSHLSVYELFTVAIGSAAGQLAAAWPNPIAAGGLELPPPNESAAFASLPALWHPDPLPIHHPSLERTL